MPSACPVIHSEEKRVSVSTQCTPLFVSGLEDQRSHQPSNAACVSNRTRLRDPALPAGGSSSSVSTAGRHQLPVSARAPADRRLDSLLRRKTLERHRAALSGWGQTHSDGDLEDRRWCYWPVHASPKGHTAVGLGQGMTLILASNRVECKWSISLKQINTVIGLTQPQSPSLTHLLNFGPCQMGLPAHCVASAVRST